MELFASSVADPDLGMRLLRALDRSHPFRGFKDVLLDFPAEQQQWFAFEEAREHEAAIEWLQLNGITAELASPLDARPFEQ